MMRRFLQYVLALCTAVVLVPAPASACPLFSECTLHNIGNAVAKAATDAGNAVGKAATDTGKAVEGAISAGGQIAAATGDGLKTAAGGGLKILRSAGELATGHPGDAWSTFKEGGQEVINGVVDVVVADGTAAVTMADPLIGRIVFGTPSVLQSVAKFLYETIEHWKGRPSCNPAAEVDRFMTIPKREIDERSRVGGAATTPIKYILSIFDLNSAWKDTGCDGGGIGRPVRPAQHSLDNFYTIDVAISAVQVGDKQVQPGRYVRLEIFPGLASYDSVERRLPGPNDVIRFSGPLLWDKDVDTDHPNGHMEIHPTSSIDFGAPAPVPVPVPVPPPAPGDSKPGGMVSPPTGQQSAPSGTEKGGAAPPQTGIGGVIDANKPKDDAQTAGYLVDRGDNLSKIAARIYGKQQWQTLFCANRKLIRNPDLIYPGQRLTAPVVVNGVVRCNLRGVPRSYHRRRREPAQQRAPHLHQRQGDHRRQRPEG